MDKILNIVVPMAGKGTAFTNAGYTFPKPLIDVGGKTMIELVIDNLKPKCKYKFIFICLKEHYDKYDLYHILQNATDNNFEVVPLLGPTQGAACTVLTAVKYINNQQDLLIANADQVINTDINDFIKAARTGEKDGLIMTFKSSHPKWSYARTDKTGRVVEVAEKRLISDKATVGLYYFKKGEDFVNAAQSMIHKDIRYDNQFFVCPTYNELLLQDKKIYVYDIDPHAMHGLGTPEDLNLFLQQKN